MANLHIIILTTSTLKFDLPKRVLSVLCAYYRVYYGFSCYACLIASKRPVDCASVSPVYLFVNVPLCVPFLLHLCTKSA